MRILLVFPPHRFDFYDFFAKDLTNDYLLLWHEKPGQSNIDLEKCPVKFKEVFFWQQFTTPSQLLEKIAPDKILFHEIIDLRQIALIVTCKAARVPTFFIDHGAAGSVAEAISRSQVKGQFRAKLTYLANRIRRNLADTLKAKFFYYAVFKKFNSLKSYMMYLQLPFGMLRQLPLRNLVKNKFPERSPDFFLIFSQLNFAETAHFHHIPDRSKFLTGVPTFDVFYTPLPKSKDYVVFIDAPYLEEGMYHWDKEFHHQLAFKLNQFAVNQNVKLYIKLHPKSDKKQWLSYEFDKELVEILQTEDCTRLFLESSLIFGYCSSLLTAFLSAHKNVVLVGWHPEPAINGFNFAETGLCHSSLNMEDLATEYNYWVSNNLSFNDKDYNKFIALANPHFDGNAGNRIIKLISTLELS